MIQNNFCFGGSKLCVDLCSKFLASRVEWRVSRVSEPRIVTRYWLNLVRAYSFVYGNCDRYLIYPLHEASLVSLRVLLECIVCWVWCRQQPLLKGFVVPSHLQYPQKSISTPPSLPQPLSTVLQRHKPSRTIQPQSIRAAIVTPSPSIPISFPSPILLHLYRIQQLSMAVFCQSINELLHTRNPYWQTKVPSPVPCYQ